MPNLARLPLLALALLVTAPSVPDPDMTRWRAEAANVTITRDDWGIAHIVGKTDADAVFGMIYAQAEDDFSRIEANYLTALGRTAEAPGASDNAMWEDLRQRLFVDPAELKKEYAASQPWLKKLMNSWADGLNFYLTTHPGTKPKVLTRFEPWMALSFTEGSIGGDIERISISELKTFYGTPTPKTAMELGRVPREPGGSNGIAIAPARTKDGHALLLINPHTSFYFRAEQQVTSGEGLNAYGAATWGQFFVYQGFNAKAGWMHTSSGADNVDEFAETVAQGQSGFSYRYGSGNRIVTTAPVTIAFRKSDGSMGERSFTTYRTHHGPIVAERDGKWIATALMWKPVPALEQSFLRTKATDLASYLTVAERKANSSNDTLFADSKGEIAFLMPQFMPVRDNRFDYTRLVDGSNPATDWRGLHNLGSLPSVLRPRHGAVRNVNDWPWDSAGPDSPKAAAFPKYMDQAGWNYRGVHADNLLASIDTKWTLEGLRVAAYDSDLPAFRALLPGLIAAYDALPKGDPRRARLAEPVMLLRSWNYRWALDSTATSLAVFWGDTLWREVGSFAQAEAMNVPDYIDKRVSPAAKLDALAAAVDRLQRDFGDWRVPWGQINRWQRLDDAIAPHFDDAAPSMSVPFASAQWGSLASFGAKPWGTKRYYGTSGNSFVAVVEFGPRVRAMAVTAGGESGNPRSKHFADQAQRYASGNLRAVYFYPDQLKGHVERRYRPGE